MSCGWGGARDLNIYRTVSLRICTANEDLLPTTLKTQTLFKHKKLQIQHVSIQFYIVFEKNYLIFYLFVKIN